jgi:hypothetical protein
MDNLKNDDLYFVIFMEYRIYETNPHSMIVLIFSFRSGK